jgi:hypothetical protein
MLTPTDCLCTSKSTPLFSQQAGAIMILLTDAILAMYSTTTSDESWQIGSVLD